MTVTVDARYAQAKDRLAKRADAAVRKQFDSAYGDKADELLNWLFGPKLDLAKGGSANTGTGGSGAAKVSSRAGKRRTG